MQFGEIAQKLPRRSQGTRRKLIKWPYAVPRDKSRLGRQM